MSAREFILKAEFQCKTPNVIHVTFCVGYKEECIGQTGG